MAQGDLGFSRGGGGFFLANKTDFPSTPTTLKKHFFLFRQILSLLPSGSHSSPNRTHFRTHFWSRTSLQSQRSLTLPPSSQSLQRAQPPQSHSHPYYPQRPPRQTPGQLRGRGSEESREWGWELTSRDPLRSLRELPGEH